MTIKTCTSCYLDIVPYCQLNNVLMSHLINVGNCESQLSRLIVAFFLEILTNMNIETILHL